MTLVPAATEFTNHIYDGADPPLTGIAVKVSRVPVDTVLGEIDTTGISVGIIVTVTVAKLLPTVYVIITVPADTPVTTPVNDPTLAIAGALLLHVPPVVASVRVSVVPTQMLVVPTIGVTANVVSDTNKAISVK